MEYSVCINALFPGLPAGEAIARVRAAGLKAWECWGWWELDVEAALRAQQAHGIRMAALCTRFVPLNDPAKRTAYLCGLRETLAVARRLHCPTIISQVGQEQPLLSRAEQTQSIIDGLRECVPLLQSAGVTLVIEPLNTLIDHPGTFLARSDEAFAIVRQVNSPHVKVLFDIYHQQITEGNLIPNLTRNAAWIGHVHIAGHPGRHEPFGCNEIHYPSVLGALKQAGYSGAVGLEYHPRMDAAESLKRLQEEIPL